MADPERPGAEQWVPKTLSLNLLRSAVDACRGCELWEDATQPVFSAGSRQARLMLVGEQPGDKEDLTGEPFIGPSGQLLDDALDAAGIDRDDAYVTNAVKHFRFEQRGKRRLHQKPTVGNIVACHPWLDAEMHSVDPGVVVCLGATAARSVLGRPAKVRAERGHLIRDDRLGRPIVITTHPSALLRIRDHSERDAAFAQFVDDLAVARDVSEQ